MRLEFSLNNIAEAVAVFWKVAKKYKVIAFTGDLGAGKTTFITQLCKCLNVQDEVSSPTFSIINEYSFIDENGTEQTIYHSDWYRLNDEREAIEAGIEDMLLNKDTYKFIEWPEKASGLLPDNTLNVFIASIDEHSRRLTIDL